MLCLLKLWKPCYLVAALPLVAREQLHVGAEAVGTNTSGTDTVTFSWYGVGLLLPAPSSFSFLSWPLMVQTTSSSTSSSPSSAPPSPDIEEFHGRCHLRAGSAHLAAWFDSIYTLIDPLRISFFFFVGLFRVSLFLFVFVLSFSFLVFFALRPFLVLLSLLSPLFSCSCFVKDKKTFDTHICVGRA